MVKVRREPGFDQRFDDDDDIRVERTARPPSRQRPERGEFERPSPERPSPERMASERSGTVKLRGVGMPRSQRTAREVQDELAREQLRRNLLGAFGLVLVAFSSAMDVALASWSVNDPSWNHLAQGSVHNFLGTSGATIADLIMQFIGLASVVLFLPVAVWGLRLMVGRPIALARARVASWVIGTLATAGFLDTLPVIQSWPLPTGLGGVVGDRILRLPVYLSGAALGGLSWWVVFITLGAFAVVLLAFSAGVSLAWPFGAPREAGDVRDDERFESDERFTWWDYLQGAVTHTRMSMLARRQRREPVLAAAGDYREPARDDDEPPRIRRSRQTAETHAFEAPTRGWTPDSGHEPGYEPAYEPGHGEEDDEPSFEAGDDEPAVESRPRPRVDLPAFADRLFTRGPAARMGRRGRVDPVDPRFDTRDERFAAADEFDDDEPPIARPRPPEPAPPARPVRVDAIARPVPGKRDIRERQGRLIEEAGAFTLPPVHLLAEPKPGQQLKISKDALEQNAHDLERVLDEFGVRGEIINVRPGPVVTLYELEPAPGIKSSRVIGLAEDIARSMSAVAARVAVIPGKNAIGIELPNSKRETVLLRELIGAQDFERTKARLAICLGKTIGGEPVIVDLTRMPHVLVAGTTGSGKSVSINTMILSLLYRLSPRDCRLIMIDPKMLELSVYDGIPHLLTPVVTDPKKAVVALKWCVREMEERYRKMSKLGVRNIDGFNSRVAESTTRGEAISRTVQTGFDRHTGEPIYETEDMDLSPLPYIVVIIDEMADLMMVAGKEIEGAVQRLAQMARAAGIHVIMATQRPSVDVITGTIKANFPTRISFQVTSKIDSRTILGEQGAEQLLGQGDMLYMAGGGRIQRVHGPFVSDEEVEDIVAHLKAQGSPDYVDSVTEEEGDDEDENDDEADGLSSGEGGNLYDQAIAIVLRDKRPTTSYIQRRLGVGYNKAASMIEQMEKDGLISPPKAGGKRDILVRNRDDDEF